MTISQLDFDTGGQTSIHKQTNKQNVIVKNNDRGSFCLLHVQRELKCFNLQQ